MEEITKEIDMSEPMQDVTEGGTESDREETAAGDSATKRYSERLNRDRAKIRGEYESQLNDYKNMEESLRALGYEGEDISQLTESIKRGLEGRTDEGGTEIVQRALDVAMKYKRMQDLESIKRVYPECDVADSLNIGEVFTKLMQTGSIDALTAYEAQMAYNKRNSVDNTASMGSVNANEVSIEKDHYTPEEASRFTRKDYERNPGLWEKVRKSMLKW